MPPRKRQHLETPANNSNPPAVVKDGHKDSKTRAVERSPQEDRAEVFIPPENDAEKVYYQKGKKDKVIRPETAVTPDYQRWFHENRHPDHDVENDEGIDPKAGDSIRWYQGPFDRIQWLGAKITNKITSYTLKMTSSAASKDRLVDTEICLGDTVELKNGAFIRISVIYRKTKAGPVMVGGELFERNMRLMGWLPRIENEVFWVWTFRRNKPSETAQSGQATAQISEVQRVWNLRVARPNVTQCNSPGHEQSSSEQAQNNAPGRGTLICRWKYVRPTVRSLHRTQYIDTNYPCARLDEKLLIAATGDDEGSRSVYRQTEKEYTFGDAFAGCGGMSRAAVMAGLKVKWGFDKDRMAIEAYATNFPNAYHGHTETQRVVTHGSTEKLKVDVLHLSPPCQPFSTANRKKKINFDDLAALFAVSEIIKKADPRIVMLEQVANIVNYEACFSGLIHMFTCLGYSIRWKVVPCIEFGVPQENRNRLILIGSR